MAEPIIRLEHITRTYHSGDVDVHALRDVNLAIDAGEFVAVMGASGSGKSTLMAVIGCLDRPSNGRYFFEGTDVAALTESVAEEMRPFDVYRGEQVGEGRQSVAVHLQFRAADRTLTDAEADTARETIVAALRERLGGELR
jgi:predicted ABC-type transport system involved in lysophospholipase L1 biosynthesis ATPase subunit